MGAKIHPIIALWRTIGKNMSAREFKAWYQGEAPEDRLELARIAAEELGCELEEDDQEPDAEDEKPEDVGLLPESLKVRRMKPGFMRGPEEDSGRR